MILPVIPWVRFAIVAAFALSCVLAGMGIHKTFSDRKIARLKLAHAERLAEANAALAKAIQDARDKETRWRDELAKKERESAEAIAVRDARIRDLVAAGSGLRNRIAAFVDSGKPTEAATAAERSLHHQVETLGVLLREVDELAEESAGAADVLRDELELCRGYIEVITK